MDIKWKNNLKLICLIVLFSFGLKGSIGGFHLFTQQNHFAKTSFFQTAQFEQQLQDFVEYLSLFELSDLTAEKAKKRITVSEQEINEHRYHYGNLGEQVENISQQYEERIALALNEGKEEIANAYIAERDVKIGDITKNFSNDEHVRQKIVREKGQSIDEFFKNIEAYKSRYLQYNDIFTYYFVDQETGNIYTNLVIGEDETVDDLFNEKTMQFIKNYHSVQPLNFFPWYANGYELEALFLQEQKMYKGQIGVPTSLPLSSEITVNKKNFHETKQKIWLYFIVSVISLFISIIFLKKQAFDSVSVASLRVYYNRLPVDIRATIFVVTSFSFFILTTTNQVFYHYYDVVFWIEDLVWQSIIAAIFLIASLIQGKLLYETWKEKPSFTNTLIYICYRKICKLIQHLFLHRGVFWKLTIITVILGTGIVFIIGVSLAEPYLLPIALLVFASVCFVIFVYVAIQFAYFNLIASQVDDLAKGIVQHTLPVKGKSSLGILAANVNSLKQGVQTSKKEVVKSERLKTELITNVSHDLRTPLTSIITYTELLKQVDLPKEDSQSYIEIIDRKSKRLKVLIDDLFEVSKMASGNIELSKEKVDIVQLLQQSLAEHDESMSKSTLQFRITKPDNPIYAFVDGKKMWRVFDNLIGNILKYSLENTRVYIAVMKELDEVVIVFKNVSKFELGSNSEELFERFKRGDISRQTEGSGLGLAIAKSIVDMHEGFLDVELDGDLFKVTLKLAILKN